MSRANEPPRTGIEIIETFVDEKGVKAEKIMLAKVEEMELFLLQLS